MLPKAVFHAFDPEVRRRGEAYFQAGCVHLGAGTDASVEATVARDRCHDVHLQSVQNSLAVSCTCSTFALDGEPCPHIWATVLAAAEHGHLDSLEGRTSVRIIPREKPAGDTGAATDPEPADLETPWRSLVDRVKRTMRAKHAEESSRGSMESELLYVVDVPATLASRGPGRPPGLVLHVACRTRRRDGRWGKPQTLKARAGGEMQDLCSEDRQIIALLQGGRPENARTLSGLPDMAYRLSAELREAVLPPIFTTGRAHLRLAPGAESTPLIYDDGLPWDLWLRIKRDRKAEAYVLTGALRRGEEACELSSPVLLVSGGWVFWPDRVARLRDFGAFSWIPFLRRRRALRVPGTDGDDLLESILTCPQVPRLDLPTSLRYEEEQGTPRPLLRLNRPRQGAHLSDYLRGKLRFNYGEAAVETSHAGRGIYQRRARRFVLRDANAEREAVDRLEHVGFRIVRNPYTNDMTIELPAQDLPRAVRELVTEKWCVEADGRRYREPESCALGVTSGIDWLEVHGRVSFDGIPCALPAILRAVKRREFFVMLDDGTFGVLPEAWLKQFGILTDLGSLEEDHVRFDTSQAGVVDAFVADRPDASCDAAFRRLRTELRRFTEVTPADPPPGFRGRLRPYQREGLGWLLFLESLGFGGCLADDMGLGKTVQVLALLATWYNRQATDPERAGPSIIVVPRSLIFNWRREAKRFTPQLNLLDNTGPRRQKNAEAFAHYDVVLTTYGTLRRDVTILKDVSFDYVVLDEAQAIKNAGTESAAAARLLRGKHRLALSGTPVENHVGELLSIVEFLNPGMLGTASVFRRAGVGTDRRLSDEACEILARALRPFILRRTKSQVAQDLPEKLEETIYCELKPTQRTLYDEVRAYVRSDVLSRIERDGLARSKIHILEALLRLRQAACHPGLIDPSAADQPSAKLDAIVPQLASVIAEGHKALVFSQFTSMLAILRQRLEAEGIEYEYLDGGTRNRKGRVERFQNEPACRVFLISLRAGGLGLNLTAAEYVFLLDPWWNPAVEAQAIDRTHRIGQTRPVFAYRLIARDTVEEKILQLQRHKRTLADAIITADNSVLRSLTREDLELLLD